MLLVPSSGHYCGTANLRKHLVDVVQTDDGQQTWTPDEFDTRFEWKNDPRKAELLAK